jgi:hypothetical protein
MQPPSSGLSSQRSRPARSSMARVSLPAIVPAVCRAQ